MYCLFPFSNFRHSPGVCDGGGSYWAELCSGGCRVVDPDVISGASYLHYCFERRKEREEKEKGDANGRREEKTDDMIFFWR